MQRPPSKAVDGTQRFKPVTPARPVLVLVDEEWIAGDLVATNGPRLQVTVVQGGRRYRRWVDADDVREDA